MKQKDKLKLRTLSIFGSKLKNQTIASTKSVKKDEKDKIKNFSTFEDFQQAKRDVDELPIMDDDYLISQPKRLTITQENPLGLLNPLDEKKGKFL